MITTTIRYIQTKEWKVLLLQKTKTVDCLLIVFKPFKEYENF